MTRVRHCYGLKAGEKVTSRRWEREKERQVMPGLTEAGRRTERMRTDREEDGQRDGGRTERRRMDRETEDGQTETEDAQRDRETGMKRHD